MTASSGLSAEEIGKQAWLARAAESLPSWAKPSASPQAAAPFAGYVRPTTGSEHAAKQAWLARTEDSRASWGEQSGTYDRVSVG